MTCWREAAIAFAFAYASTAAAQAPPLPPEELPTGAEVQTRGPVHEAFDEPVTVQAQAGIVAPNEPPANIEEVPPSDRPRGDGYVWVPGYWAWDADRNDFIWVSACWRVAPPNMYWVPGYWTPANGGWEWIPGFWSPSSREAINYLPAPPEAVEIEPPGPPPGLDRVWVPGCWYWSGDRYVRRSGYWLRAQPDWVWVPSHYQWTPRGYVFLQGHWDYVVERRGVLFAPVYFPPEVHVRIGFSYTPTIAIDLGLLTVNLFAYPRYSHYYFGDYYDDAYLRVGIFPRFECERRHTWYDPSYQYDRWHNHRAEPRWGERQREDYDRRRSDVALRPPRTYREMETRMSRLDAPQRRAIQVAGPVRTIAREQAHPLTFEPIDADQRRKIARNGPDVSKFRDERAKWEGTGGATQRTSPAVERERLVQSFPAPPRAGAPQRETPAERGSLQRKGLVDRPQENRGPAATPRENRGERGAPEHGPALVAPRAVAPTRPERVSIPPPPIVTRQNVEAGKVQRTPQPPPAERRREAAPPKGNPKDRPRGNKEKRNE